MRNAAQQIGEPPVTNNPIQPTDAGSDQVKGKDESKPEATPQPQTPLQDENACPFVVSIGDVFDGPLDLLLALLRKQDINVWNIPIAKITAQFQGYVAQLRVHDIDMAADFIFMSAVLIQIKSRMLLPTDPNAPDGAREDPRQELVERLLEHEREQMKQAAQLLLQKQEVEEAKAPRLQRPIIDTDAEDEKPEEPPSPPKEIKGVDLVKLFESILDRAQTRSTMKIKEEVITIGKMTEYICGQLNLVDRPMKLKHILSHFHSRISLTCGLLAILEMARLQAIAFRQDELFGEVMVKKSTGFESFLNAGKDTVKDDWK
jgi:segregation and condensation protein A